MSIESVSTRARSERIENIQALRGVAALLVLLYHIGVYEGRLFSAHALLPHIVYFGRSGVDLFFVISGFVMVTITQGRNQGTSGAGNFLLRRVLRIYPLYWFYSLIALTIYLLIPAMTNRPDGLPGVTMITSFLLLPSGVAPLVGQGWTLVHEMYFYAVFALVLLRPERERAGWLAVWGLIVLSVCGLRLEAGQSSAMLALVFHPMTLEFLAGCAIAWMVKRGLSKFPVPVFLCGVATLTVSAFLPTGWNRVWLYLLPMSLLVFGAAAVEARQHYQFPRWLRWTGDISYSLYLSHVLVLQLVRKIFERVGVPSGIGSTLLFAGIAGSLCLAAGALSYYWVEKPLLARAQGLTAKRSASPSLTGLQSPDRRKA